jgi:hypothetical protein
LKKEGREEERERRREEEREEAGRALDRVDRSITEPQYH